MEIAFTTSAKEGIFVEALLLRLVGGI